MSSDSGGSAGAPVEHKDLLDYFHASAKPREGPLRIGMEFELLPVDPETGRAMPFLVAVQSAFLSLLERPGYQPAPGPAPPTTILRGAAQVNLEPGGQTEISGAPFVSLVEGEREMREMLADFGAVARDAGFAYLSLALQPVSLNDEIEMVPKRRYAIMADHLSRRGGRRFGDMMLRTASIQASFDYVDEADAGRKLRLGMLASPVSLALFANSPLESGAPSGLASVRGAIWRETDNARCGLIPAAVDGAWSFERYVEHALGVPAILARAEDGGVEYAQGRPFGELLRDGLDGRRMTLADWELHLSTLFTEARMKRVVEVRSCDTTPPGTMMSVPAFWTGLLYHGPSLEAALALLEPHRASWPELNAQASRQGLRAPLLRGLARDLAVLSRTGLRARGLGEERFLDPVDDWIAEGRSPADRVVEAFQRGGIAAAIEAVRI